jgi:hypothetical protein
MSTAIDRPTITVSQYHSLQPLTLQPTPEALFAYQVWKLKEVGLDLLDTDINRLSELIPQEPQLFLVIPRRPGNPDWRALMRLVTIDGTAGLNRLTHQEYLADKVPTWPQAHLLIDVEDGREYLNKKPSDSFRRIQQKVRIPYTVWYGIIHCILFPFVLQDHSLDLCGTIYHDNQVPNIGLRLDRVPSLDCGSGQQAHPDFGTPSVGSIRLFRNTNILVIKPSS